MACHPLYLICLARLVISVKTLVSVKHRPPERLDPEFSVCVTLYDTKSFSFSQLFGLVNRSYISLSSHNYIILFSGDKPGV